MKNKFVILTALLSFLILIQFTSASHYIIGVVEDAKDGTTANDHTIMLWNSAEGADDNLTDIIGQNGNSQADNIYMIDCELLRKGCNISSTLTLKVINNGDNYVSEEINVTVTGAGYDVVNNITLNSPPNVSLIFPENFLNISQGNIDFNCSVFDLDEDLVEIGLFGDWGAGWHLNETRSAGIGESIFIFQKNIPEGEYKYNCEATDSFGISSFYKENKSFTVDLTYPLIESVLINATETSINKSVQVNCTTYDTLSGVDEVLLEAISPIHIGYIPNIIGENIYSNEVYLNQSGTWQFNCFSKDRAGNQINLTSSELTVSSEEPIDFYIDYMDITLNESSPIENQEILLDVIIQNSGDKEAENIIIGFFEGNPLQNGVNIKNTSVNLSRNSLAHTNISWRAKIGPTSFYIIADMGNSVEEEDESNNIANRTFSINSWQEIYGNTSVDKIIGGQEINILKWFNESNLEGNIFVSDSESSINWLALKALGKSKQGDSSNDFAEIDEILGMENFYDSISNVFTHDQTPIEDKNIIVYQNEIIEVPVINSTENSAFITGILWDSSDDISDGEFDSQDKEDIIFVAPIIKNTWGKYGFYDYEIKIPSRLREYNQLDTEEVYLYYDLN